MSFDTIEINLGSLITTAKFKNTEKCVNAKNLKTFNSSLKWI